MILVRKTFMVLPVGKVGLKYPLTTRTFMHLKMFPMEMLHKFFSLRRALTLHAGHLFILLRVTIETQRKNFRCYISSTDGAKMKLHGATRDTPVSYTHLT